MLSLVRVYRALGKLFIKSPTIVARKISVPDYFFDWGHEEFDYFVELRMSIFFLLTVDIFSLVYVSKKYIEYICIIVMVYQCIVNVKFFRLSQIRVV